MKKFAYDFLKWFLVLNVICFIVMCSMGCSAAWISAFPILVKAAQVALTAIAAFIGAFSGLSADAKAGAQKIISDAITQLGNAVSVVQAGASNITAGVLAEVQSILQAVGAEIPQILSGLSISNSTALATLTNLISLAIAAVQAVLALIPVVAQALPKLATMSDDEKAELDANVSDHMKAAHKLLQNGYKQVVTHLTGDEATDAAIIAMKQQVPSIP
jgi:hypothetical protein